MSVLNAIQCTGRVEAMTKPVIILYFDDSQERAAAVASAQGVEAALGTEHCDIVPLLQTTWQETLLSLSPDSIYFLCSHGGIGEDGTLQEWLEEHRYRHTHSPAHACTVLFDKHSAKTFYKAHGIPTPPWTLKRPALSTVSNGKDTVIAKPRTGGSKQGITKLSLLGNKLKEPYLYEQLIEGTTEVSVAVIRMSNEVIVLPPIIRKRCTDRIGVVINSDQPLQLPNETLKQCKDYAVTVFEAAQCYGVTKTDFIIDEANAVWAIETDVLPGLGKHNACVTAAKQHGIEYEDLVRIILTNTFIP